MTELGNRLKEARETKGLSLDDLQEITRIIYGEPNDRFFNTWEIMANQEKFMMRAIKGIRKNNLEKIRKNLVITTGWYISLLNRLHINLAQIVWQRFPRLCSYCGSSPCNCKITKPKTRAKIEIKNCRQPRTLKEYQTMFNEIYPAKTRNLEHAGIHLAEEDGELSEAVQSFHGSHDCKYFGHIIEEAADYFSCLMGIFNSTNLDFETEMMNFYTKNCHSCHKVPCVCNFKAISDFKS